MKTFKVNADYESVLFRGQIGSPALNHTLEFLYFFLENGCLLTEKNYAADYLDYVEKVSGNRPIITKTASKTYNWWGLQENIEIERWWNSKITTVEFLQTKKWVPDLHLIETEKDLDDLDPLKDYLIKDPFLMSGQRFQTSRGKITWNKEHLLIAEPLLNRIKDFSTYVYSDGSKIFYENVVDNKFQYKGSIFRNIQDPSLEQLSFYHELESFKWDNFKTQLSEIMSHYSRYPNQIGYSIDSFIYQDNGLRLYPLCEVNYRRTMGRIAYELGLKFGKDKSYVGFFLAKTGKEPLWKKLRENKDVIVFSPGDSRFEMFMLFADSPEDAERLLANTQAAIDL